MGHFSEDPGGQSCALVSQNRGRIFVPSAAKKFPNLFRFFFPQKN